MIFFLGAQNGVFWVGAKKFKLNKFMYFFGPLTIRTFPEKKWEIGFVVFETAFWGRPGFQSRGPKILILKGLGAIWGKNLGHPKRRSSDHGSNAPFSAL